jgi:hexosaminidase
MIDSARNFLPEADILTTIDGLSYNKMNVLHWHLSDSQSFPFVSQTYPEMSKAGAYEPSMTYPPDSVARIVSHALARGVRVIPEFDVPGHAYAGYDAIPGNLTVCGNHQPWTDTCVEPPCGQLDITHPGAAKVYDGLLGDIAALFPDEYVHTGGDEVQYKCWNSSDTMRAYVQSHYGDLSEASWTKLWNVFQAQMLESTSKRQRTVIQWEGAFKSGLAMGPKTTVQAWLGPAAIASATKAGHQVIASEYNYWYYFYYYCLPSTLFALNYHYFLTGTWTAARATG